MIAEADIDPDGKLYALTRSPVNPSRPGVATVDLHANISEPMVAHANVIMPYHINPRVDPPEYTAGAVLLLCHLILSDASKCCVSAFFLSVRR
jgi:microcystin degradation protein MlrC